MKLNYGCGETKLEGFINIDLEPTTKPDLICDLRKEGLPYEKNSVETIYCIHNIEHIEYHFWPHVLYEFHRVLKPQGELVLMYPEWETCAKYFLENHLGMRDFWRKTLYGRQDYPGDYHVTPVMSGNLSEHLSRSGFVDVRYKPETGDTFNTVLQCKKGFVPNKEDLLRHEIYRGSLVPVND